MQSCRLGEPGQSRLATTLELSLKARQGSKHRELLFPVTWSRVSFRAVQLPRNGVLGMCGPKVPASPVFRFWKYFDMHGTPRAPWSPRSSRNKTVTPGQLGELNIKIVRRENVPCFAFPQLNSISGLCLIKARFVPCFPGLCSSQSVDLR